METKRNLPPTVAFDVNSSQAVTLNRIVYQVPDYIVQPAELPFFPSEIAPFEYTDASGTSAVAIDNKIEQAMDLVKSHLMFAVREEVEVLKEKIAELMDRINQLELENTILKAHASQETLAQLGGSGNPQQSNKNQQTQPPPNGSVS